MSDLKITVPDMGDFKDVEIIEVLVKEGQTINKNDSLITLESDKSSVEVPSTQSGTINKINVKVGDKVNQGDLILTLKSSEKVEQVKDPVAKIPEKKLDVKKIAIFTPYSKKLNDEVVSYFSSEGFEITSNSYLDIKADYDIGKVDQNFLFKTLSQIEIKSADALFISCTALPVLNIIERLEKKLGKPVITSNQSLIWDTLESIGMNKDCLLYTSDAADE